MRTLEEREQALRFGTREGATFVEDDFEIGEMQNAGEAMVGLIDLQARLALAQDQLKRYSEAGTTIEDRIKNFTEVGRKYKESRDRVAKFMDELAAEMKKATEEIMNRVSAAGKLETQALESARASLAAFTDSRNRSEKYQSAARQVMSDRDTQGTNSRLKQITSDATFSTIPSASEAAARTHIASVQYNRLYGIQLLVRDMRMLRDLNPEFSFDEAVFIQDLEINIKDAENNLTEAAKQYESMLSKMGPADWTVLAAQSGVKLLESLVRKDQDWRPDEASRSAAAQLVQRAFTGRDRHPLLQSFIPYRNHLGVSAAPAPETPKPEEGEGEGTAESGE